MRNSKLVRDNIPEIVAAKWEFAEFYIASDDEEYYQKLREKIAEELNEILFAPNEELTEELADLKEVLNSIAKFKNLVIEKLDIEDTIDSEINKLKLQISNALTCISYISRVENISLDEIEKTRIEKKKIKWGFDNRIILKLK